MGLMPLKMRLIQFKHTVIYKWIHLVRFFEDRVWNVIEPSISAMDIMVLEHII